MKELNDLAKAILFERYLDHSNEEEPETPEQMFKRVALVVSGVEKSKELKEEWYKKFYGIMSNLDFIPNSPTLANAGRATGQLSGCFVLPINDSMDSIMKTMADMALIQKSGGGTGMSFSKLRREGGSVSSTHGTSSGPISFMTMYNAVTDTVKQGGMRRGANMGIMRVDHPNILEFCTCKREEGKLANFNISVAITDAFMQALAKGALFDLVDPHEGKVVETLPAQKIFDVIVEGAWHNGEPGIVFIDKINQDHSLNDEIESTNPCGEQPLLPYESCNLGSINLANMVTETDEFDEDKLVETVEIAVRFLDNVIDATRFPLEKIERVTLSSRKIGLGIMGWHDFLVKLGIAYDSIQALEWADKVMELVQETAMETSVELGQEKGPFPAWQESKYKDWKTPPRNAERTTIAPTGTISSIAGCSSGIEPYFRLCYNRNIMDRGFFVTNPLLESHLSQYEISWNDLMQKDGQLKDTNVSIHLKRLFKTSTEIDPVVHVKVQAAFQKYTDNAVSKTINMPYETEKEQIAEIILIAYRLGCKGITVYRDGSRQEQVLDTRLDWPKERPEKLMMISHKDRTGCGNIFVDVAMIGKKPYEVKTNIGKAGACENAWAEALCRVISISLRHGTPAEEIVKQLRGIRCPSALVGKVPKLSCPDVIGQKIEEEMKGAVDAPEPGKKKNTCSCGGEIVYQGGCYLCLNCGKDHCGG